MRHLSIDGKIFEISEHHYLNIIKSLAKGYYDLGKSYDNLHASGFADWQDGFQILDVGQIEFIKDILDQIDDDELSEAVNSLINLVDQIIVADRNIVNWLAAYVGLSTVQDKKDNAKLERRLKKVIVGGPDKGPQGPVWVMESGYQALIEISELIMVQIRKAYLQVDKRVQYLIDIYPQV